MLTKENRKSYLMVGPAALALMAATMMVLPAFAAEDAATSVAEDQQKDALTEGFQSPPNSARPRVWWHWMNGNISTDGISKDLEWMSRIGIGGVQNFDANISTPQVVDKRLVYMSPEWKAAFRHAVGKADSLGLEFAIAASPGWSETGGPWVEPEDGLKKTVWSEMTIKGGQNVKIMLPPLPRTLGPYLDVPKGGQSGGDDEALKTAQAGGDIALFAVPITTPALPYPRFFNNGILMADTNLLSDGKSATRIRIDNGTTDAPGDIRVVYDRPQTIRAVHIYLPGSAGIFSDASLLPVLEASDGANWIRVAEMPLTNVATTISFPPVIASEFRVVLATNKRKDRFSIAPLRHPRNAQLAELRLSSGAMVDQFETKSALALEKNYYLPGNGKPSENAGLAPGSIIDLTSRLQPDGSLEWKAPKGKWRIIRLGWSLTGAVNHPAPAEATGLEVDKLDSEAVQRYIDHYLAMYRSATGDSLAGKNGLDALLNDSTEIGAMNWSPKLVTHFREMRGYDPTPWLPTLAGTLVGTREQSDGFLYDYRRTLADLHANAHYGTIAAAAHKAGMIHYSEALEGRRPTIGDDMDMRRFADIPMAAMWTYPKDKGPAANYLADLKGASSVAHIYGQNLAASETLTSNAQFWSHSPKELKAVIDLAFIQGINRPVIHTSVHQPVDDKKPGISLGTFGQHFNRHDSWAEMAKPWIDYISRSAFLLQQGRNVADVAYFYGEEAPLVELYGVDPIADAPSRHAWDFLNPDALLNQLRVENGEIVTKGGARYKILQLGGTSYRMTLPALKRLAELVDAGATIVGQAPQSTPSLADDRSKFAELRKLLWAGAGETRIGKGRVIADMSIDPALEKNGIAPGFSYSGSADADIRYVHRQTDDEDIFFINNRKDRPEKFEARFRVGDARPELWRAETGRAHAIRYQRDNGQTALTLDLDPEEAIFVIFRKGDAARRPLPVETPKPGRLAATLDKGWTVSFEQGRGAPSGTVTLGSLSPLNENPDPAIRYFSGVATYRASFNLPKGSKPDQTLWLDLGSVGDLAQVFVNGKLAATPWHAPWLVDIGSAVTTGTNKIEIRVANRWVNRLIGDAQKDVATKISWTSQRTYGPGAPLTPSGLIGPVRLYTATQ